MNKREFYEKLKIAISNEHFRSELIFRGDLDSDARRLYLAKVLYYLIGTRDFDNFDKYVQHYYRDLLPYEYLKEIGYSQEKSESIVYENLIRNGFLFHVTQNYNVDRILASGLQTLNDKYGCDLYKKCKEINELYSRIRERNNHRELLRSPLLIDIPGLRDAEESRFKTVFLSSDLDYILKTYGDGGELFSFFIRDLFWAFKCSDVNYGSLEELKIKIVETIKNSGIVMYDSEINNLLDFVELMYEEKIEDNRKGKSIIMVPVDTIESDLREFEMMYQKNTFGFSPHNIIEYHNGEITSSKSIKLEDIIVIDNDEDRGISLRIK